MAGEKVDLLGVQVDSLTRVEILKRIADAVRLDERLLVAHANLRGLNLAYEQPWLRGFYQRAQIVYCDGMGVMLGARLTRQRIRERFTLADWVWQLAALAVDLQARLFLLGNPPGVAQAAAHNLLKVYPEIQIAGVQHGFFTMQADGPENLAVISRINELKPHILLVGFGMPLQERWLDENWERLNVNVAITCGALFEYLAGDLKRGPQWMNDHYLEWLARLIISPGRYAARYLYDIPVFFYRTMRQGFHAK
ncbi:MAG: hypothetical protein B6D39_06705 [Anaerolineae bacterium UTCFX2]|jgi:N-acetylglucosaminyldiphosphoundecaprenol N-acetyl-beta-D-mannosaminyltransferase|nr:WecB/TagA/CpsF family glycosyltransferase [Anaerolineales bacterium]OQY91520.1 MAG: hypothetical protein B6D39_06705 [Anaerolineae bacterium UTCFX2]